MLVLRIVIFLHFGSAHKYVHFLKNTYYNALAKIGLHCMTTLSYDFRLDQTLGKPSYVGNGKDKDRITLSVRLETIEHQVSYHICYLFAHWLI